MSCLRKEKALVLNKSWVAISTVSLESAFCILFRETASVVCPETYGLFGIFDWIEYSQTLPKNSGIKTATSFIAKPEVILLNNFSRVPHRTMAFTRKNLYKRDDFTCQYCLKGMPNGKLTIDHIIPRSRGGRSTWENCVLACKPCNGKKANKSLEEVGFVLNKKPQKPDWTIVSDSMYESCPKSWLKFIGDRKGN